MKNLYRQWAEQNPSPVDPQLEAILVWAVWLHEVGLSINLSGLHRHSAYILQNTNLRDSPRNSNCCSPHWCVTTAKR